MTVYSSCIILQKGTPADIKFYYVMTLFWPMLLIRDSIVGKRANLHVLSDLDSSFRPIE